jgi:hypothetical protein
LFFRELVVPEIGRMWFVRQISWPVAALALHEELRSSRSRPPKPTAICHGIEALACKLEYTPDRDNRSTRILGTRAFGRDLDSRIWTFDRLRQATNYVRNTHRQAATRAIREVRGPWARLRARLAIRSPRARAGRACPSQRLPRSAYWERRDEPSQLVAGMARR